MVSEHRDDVVKALASEGIPTALFYPRPLHTQGPYRSYPVAGNDLPVTELLARQVVSLPMHPYLDSDAQDRVIAAVRAALTR